MAWTTEVNASLSAFIERAEQGFADFLFLKYRAGMFAITDHRDEHPPAPRLTLTRTKPAHVPDQFPAEEEMGT
jgi:hypothetical protein